MRTPDDFVQWLDELFTALELHNINVIGHSYGGWQASLYALAHPERLKKLVLLAPASAVLRPPLGLMVRAILYTSSHSVLSPGGICIGTPPTRFERTKRGRPSTRWWMSNC